MISKLPFFTVLTWLCVFYLFIRRFRGIFELDEFDQKLMYYSESSFYLSFYFDIVNADSWNEIFFKLFNDNRSEYPDTVIAFRRLNITHEIILGFTWRILNFGQYFTKPFDFYAYSALLVHSFGISVLFSIAVDFNQSIASGIFFLGLFLSNFQYKLISRIIALPLRENFATPALWLSILSLKRIFESKDRKVVKWHYILFISNLWMLLTWQFSVQIISTQLASIFAINLLGMISDEDILRLLHVYSVSLLLSSTIMLFPTYFLFSMLTNILISLYTSALLPFNIIGGFYLSTVKIRKGLISLLVYGLNHVLMNSISRPDSHINDMFFVKLGLSKPNFDTVLYSLGIEFNFFPNFMFQMIRGTNLFIYLAITLLVMIFSLVHKRKDICDSNSIFIAYFTLQTIIFVLLTIMTARLRILALPLLCVYSTFLFNFSQIKYSHNRSLVCVILTVVAISPYYTMSMGELKQPPYGELYNSKDSKQLIQWVNDTIPTEIALLSDMPTSSIIRSATNNKIVINPQYESYSMRMKTRFLYTLGDCVDVEWFGDTMYKLYNCEYVIVPKRFCTMFEKEDANKENIYTLLKLNPYTKCDTDNTPYHARLCNRLLVNRDVFELLFSNGAYFVFKYNKKHNSIVTISDWNQIHKFETFSSWLNKCSSNDKTCQLQIYSTSVFLNKYYKSPVAKEIIDYGIELYPDDEKMIRYYAEFMDYDYGDYDIAKIYYLKLISKMNRNCSSTDDFILISQYLRFLIETKGGSYEEMMDAIDISESCLADVDYSRIYSEHLCKYANELLSLFRGYKYFKNDRIRSLSNSFWVLSQKHGKQFNCFYENYESFKSKPLTRLEILKFFLFD